MVLIEGNDSHQVLIFFVPVTEIPDQPDQVALEAVDGTGCSLGVVRSHVR